MRIRRISLFDINQHREEMERVKAELAETRKNLKNLTRYAIGHLEALLEKYGPLYPRLTTKSARHEEVDVKAVAFKAFKVSLRPRERLRGLQSQRRRVQARVHQVRQDVAGLQGRHLQGQRTAGETVCRPGAFLLRPARPRTRVHLRLHGPAGELPQALHIRRHDPEQGLFVHSGEIAHSALSRPTRRRFSTSATNPRRTRRSTSRRATRTRSR